LLALCIVVFGATPAFFNVVTLTKEYTYQASEFDSKYSSRTLALEQVTRLLLEEKYYYGETNGKNNKWNRH